MTTKNSTMSIGGKLRKLRQNKGYSQEYMAETLNISQKTYSNMENEKASISVETLKLLATELEVDVLELLSDGKVIVQYNTSQDTSTFNGVVNQHASEDIINSYKQIIEDFRAIIADLKSQITLKDELLKKM